MNIEVHKSEALPHMTFFPIEQGFYIGANKKSEISQNKLFMNHSCNPNVGYKGQITFVAMRNIRTGEELAFDWAMCTDEQLFLERFQVQLQLWKPKL